MNRGVLQISPVQQIMAAGNPSRWPCYINNGISRAPELVIPSNNSSNFLPPFPSSPPCSSGWHDVHNQQEDLQQSWTQLLRGGLVGEEDDEEEEDEKSGMSSSQAKRVKTWQEQVLFEQAQQEHVSPPSMEFVKQENSTNNYLLYGGHPNDQGAAKLSAPTKNWSSLSSSPKSCITSYGTNNLLNFPTISKSNARHPPPNRSPECNSNGAGGAQKKARLQSSSTQSPFKVRKEKLGDRIAALHQLVSPFGKTDTASVLLEATGYIRFLHSQIEALSLPYLGKNSGDLKHKVSNNYNSMQRKGAPNPQVCGEEEEEEEEVEEKKELRSRGLCLVPISCTVDHQVGNESYVNGADYWAQACFQSGQPGGGFC